jgi:ribose/xylose/arabinose/galactoside ABC-type transport system permease subunit
VSAIGISVSVETFSRAIAVLRSPRRIALVFVRTRTALLLLLTVGLSAWMTIGYPNSFPTTFNIEAILVNASVSAIMVCGMTVLLIGGVFDLSIGGIMTMTGVVTGDLIVNRGVGIPLAIAGGLAVGVLAGLFNGFLVTRIGINALITTLATSGIYYGLTQLLASSGVSPISNAFGRVGQDQLFGLQTPFWVMVVIVVVMAVGVAKTRFFRQFYFVGGNERASRYSGIRSGRVLLTGFVLMGFLSAVGGVMTSARLDAATPSAGIGLELSVITAAVLGGASLKGGEGSIIGGVLGVLFIAIVNNALIIVNVDVFWQQIVIGAVLLVAVSLDRWKGRLERIE